jgi:Ser/Thr protein kinase RdoA (MazF antagonist)
MENRVYEIEIYEGAHPTKIVGKFYRPHRWSYEQIREEHQLLRDLEEAEISVVCPLEFSGETVFKLKESEIMFSLFPKKSGRLICDPNIKMLKKLGEVMGRMHIVSRRSNFKHRISLNNKTYIKGPLALIKNSQLLDANIISRLDYYSEKFSNYYENYIKSCEQFRVHGDLHFGNVLWQDDEPLLIDFDDCLMGPLAQDLWLSCPYPTEEKSYWDALYEGYEFHSHLPNITDKMIEVMRAMRLIHYSGWICKRYNDPTFQTAFPDFKTERFWQSYYEEFSRIEHVVDTTNFY